jgi:hypothetical protein
LIDKAYNDKKPLDVSKKDERFLVNENFRRVK